MTWWELSGWVLGTLFFRYVIIPIFTERKGFRIWALAVAIYAFFLFAKEVGF